MLTKSYDYFATCDPLSKYPQGAYDGDTIDMVVDVGFRMSSRQRLRVLGINTPELRGKSKEDGLRFRQLTRAWLQAGLDTGLTYPFMITTAKSDAFGRYLASIKRTDTGEDLTEYLLRQGAPLYEKG